MLAPVGADGGRDGPIKRELEAFVVLADPELGRPFRLAADQFVVSDGFLGVRRCQGGLGAEGGKFVLCICI